MGNLIVFILILFLVNPVSGGATLYMKVVEFFNPENLNILGKCCDGVMIGGKCSIQCSYTFLICFNRTECTPKTTLAPNGTNKNVSSDVITASFDIWGTIKMYIDIYDEDTQYSELIDQLYLEFKHFPFEKEQHVIWTQCELVGTRQQKPTRLKLKMLPMCEENFFGENCSTKCVAQNTCSGHYTCGKKGQKICNDGWSGVDCKQPAIQSKRCILNETCNNGGTCAKQKNEFYCCCPPKYEGRQCEKVKPCNKILCENGGTCSVNGTCTCPVGFSGPFCEIELTTTHITDIMTPESSSHVTITQSPQCPKDHYGPHCDVLCRPQNNCKHGSYKCNEKGERVCQAGWIAPQCEMPKIKCSENGCRNNGSCKKDKCCCPPSFNGILCQNEIIQCESNPCKNGGICEDQIGSIRCLCQDGFAGSLCEITIGTTQSFGTTQSSRPFPEVTKTMIEDISTTNSSHVMTTWETSSCPPNRYGDTCNVTCIAEDNNSVGHWMCDSKGQKQCKPGWTDPLCKIRTNVIILCSSEPNICRHGECVNKSCICFKGYEGIYCQREILECLSEPCQNGGHCVDEIGFFTCICKPGFTGTTCNKRRIEHTTITETMPPDNGERTTENVANKTVDGTRDTIIDLSKSTKQVSANTVTSNFPSTTQLGQVSSTVESRDVSPTIEAVTVSNLFTFKTTEGHKHGGHNTNSLLSTSLKTPKNDFLTRTFTLTVNTQSITSNNVTRSPTNTSLVITASVSPTSSKPEISSTTSVTGDNKSIPLSSPLPISSNANITVNSIDMSTVTKKIPMVTMKTKSTNSEFVTNIVSKIVTVQTTHGNDVTRIVSRGTTDTVQHVRTNFTIFLRSWIPDSNEFIRKVIKLAWTKQKSINNSSKMDFHVETLAVFLCLTRNGQKVTEFIFSVSRHESRLIPTKAPTVGNIALIFKNMGCVYEVYIGRRPWRYEYHYELFVKKREELPWSVEYNNTLTNAWLKTYTEFRKYVFEIAIVLSERYLLRNGTEITKFTYFVLSNYHLVDPKMYPAPSLSEKLAIFSPNQKNPVLRYKDTNSVSITKIINDNDYEQLERVLKKSLMDTFKELNESCDLRIEILKKEKFITLDRNIVWKVIFKIFNSSSIVSFPQNKLNDSWFDQIDKNLNCTEPFKMRGNRVYRNNTAIDSFYTYIIILNGFIPYKLYNTLELHLLKIWRNSTLDLQGHFTIRILQIYPSTGDYGSEAAMVVYVVYNGDKLLNPQHKISPSTDLLNAHFNQGPFYGIYRGNKNRLISNDFIYSFTLNHVVGVFRKYGFQLRDSLVRVWSRILSDPVGSDVNPVQISFAKSKLVLTTNNSIVSKIHYFALNDSMLLNPRLIDGPRMKLLKSEGIDVYNNSIRPLMKLEVKKSYVNLRQLQQIKSALVKIWTPKGSAKNVKIFTSAKEQLINNTGHIHTRLWYFINLEVHLANPDFSLIPDYLDFDANRRLYRLNIVNAYKRIEKIELIIIGLKKAWEAANKGVSTNVLQPIIHSWDHNYHKVTWGFVTQIFYTLTIEGIESSLTALSEPTSEDYEPVLQEEAKIGLCNCTALRGHFFYLVGSLTPPSLLGQIEKVVAFAWRNVNFDFAGNITAHLRTVDDTFASENKDVFKVTYIIVPIFGGVIIPDEELQPVTEAIMIKTFEKHLPSMQILTKIPTKRKYLLFWPIISVCIVIGSVLILLLLLCVLYAHRKRIASREENLIADPKLLKGYNREHFASEPESPNEFKNTASIYIDSIGPKSHYSHYGNQITSGSYDININYATDMNNFEINSSKLSNKEKNAVKLLPPKDNRATHIQLESVQTKEGKIDQFMAKNTTNEIKANEIATFNETDNILLGSTIGTHVTKSADTAESKVAAAAAAAAAVAVVTAAVDDDLTSGVDSKKETNKQIKQKAAKSAAKHVTINLDSINSIESSRDSNKKNEKEKESFPMEVDSTTESKNVVQLLESPREKEATINKVNEISNQNNVNTESNSAFINSEDGKQELIQGGLETLTTVSSCKKEVDSTTESKNVVQLLESPREKEATTNKVNEISNQNNVNTETSLDSNKKNEKEKESFPIEVDSTTESKNVVQLLESPREKEATTNKVNEISNQNNVNTETNSAFINSEDGKQELIQVGLETVTTVSSSKKEVTFKSDKVDDEDTKSDNVLNKDMKTEDTNILNGSILSTDDTKKSEDSKILLEGNKKIFANETSTTILDIDLKTLNEMKTSSMEISSGGDEDITVNPTISDKDNETVLENKASAAEMSVNLDKEGVNQTIANGKSSHGSIVDNIERNVSFENKLSMVNTSSAIGFPRVLQQLKTNQEIKHTITISTHKENELLNENKSSVENSPNLRHSVADNIKTFEEFFSTHKLDSKKPMNEMKISQAECLENDGEKTAENPMKEATQKSLIETKESSTISTEDQEIIHSQNANGDERSKNEEKEESSFISISSTNFNGYDNNNNNNNNNNDNTDVDKRVNSNRKFVTIIKVGESN